MYGILQARLPFPAEQVILDICHVSDGDNAEAVTH